MTWDEDRCIWTVSFRETNNPTKTFQREATAVVCAVGKLDLPSIPKIPGQESFAGHQMHSARWDHSVDVRGRDVIVLGNGASATQFVPVIAPEVKTLTQFLKSAHYIQERHNPTFSSSFKWCMRHIPLACRVYRWAWAIEYDLGFGAFFMAPDGAEKRKAVAQETWDYIEKAAPEK
jgi:cation diffusion facilitator CzcD-associated flavoprotein CzcO